MQQTDTPLVAGTDLDLAEQAKPGHGIPSQDPDAAAQYPIESERADGEKKTVLAGGGVIAGAAAGAAIGAAVAGPVGVFVGVPVGAIAGALSGVAAGSLVKSSEPDPK